jgi:hypothetical protein
VGPHEIAGGWESKANILNSKNSWQGGLRGFLCQRGDIFEAHKFLWPDWMWGCVVQSAERGAELMTERSFISGNFVRVEFARMRLDFGRTRLDF